MAITIPITYTPAPSAPAPSGGSNMGLLSALSGPISSGIDYFSAKDTNKRAKKLAREQMSFQERMSNTAYQRAVKDMRTAGINPMLAYMKGGASTPQGAQPKLQVPRVGEGTAKALGIASNIKLQRAQKEQVLANAGNAKAMERQNTAGARTAEVTANWYERNPNMAPAASVMGAAGSIASGAGNLGRTIKQFFGK